jgi:hypothetical protein
MSGARDIVHFLNLRIGSTPVSSWDSKVHRLALEWLRIKSPNGLRQGKYRCAMDSLQRLIKFRNQLIYKKFVARWRRASPVLTGIIVVI